MRYDNDTVRRRDRLLERTRAEELLRTAEYGVLSLRDRDGGAYGIPVSYVWDGLEAIYIHCAPQGHKLRCLELDAAISLTVVGRTRVVPEHFTTAYESVVVRGKARCGLTPEERMHALELLVGKYSPEHVALGRTYAERSFHRTEVIRIDTLCASGKCKKIS